MVSKLQIDDVREVLLHKPRHDLAERSRTQVLSFLDNVIMGGYRGYRRRVGRGAAYALLLHRAYQRSLGISRGRLRELLVGSHLLKRQDFALTQRRERIGYLRALLVFRFLIHRGVTREFHLGIRRAEAASGGYNIDGDIIIHGVRHLAGRKAPPDKAVEPVLLLRQILAHKLRRELHVGGPYGLVRVLRAGLGLVVAGGLGIVALPVAS